ncbi:hypothetical protein [Streptomyces sp. NPDC046860]|uniref:hypothetical protein n=1 Tax=Streptomyces sp. NPDC046860 TaxID=3154495 RepID=UPI0033D9F71E
MARGRWRASGRVADEGDSVVTARLVRRDLLVAGGLAGEVWPEVLEAELGSP